MSSGGFWFLASSLDEEGRPDGLMSFDGQRRVLESLATGGVSVEASF